MNKKKNDAADKYEVFSTGEVCKLFKRVFSVCSVEQDHVLEGILDPACLCMRCEKKRIEEGGPERSKCRHALRQLNRQLKQEADRKNERDQRDRLVREGLAAEVIQHTWVRMLPAKRRWGAVFQYRKPAEKRAVIIMLSTSRSDQSVALEIGKSFEMLQFKVEYWTDASPDPSLHPTKANLTRFLESFNHRTHSSEFLTIYIVSNTSSGPLQGYVATKRQEDSKVTTPRGRLRRTFAKSINKSRSEGHILRYVLPCDMVKECSDSVVLLDDLLEIIGRVPTIQMGQYNCPLEQRLLIVDGTTFGLVSSTVSAEVLYDYSNSKYTSSRGFLSMLLLKGLYGGAFDKTRGISATSLLKYLHKGMTYQKVTALVKDNWGIPLPPPVVTGRLKRIKQTEQLTNEKSRYELILQHEPWKFTRSPWDIHHIVFLDKAEQLCIDLVHSLKAAHPRKSISKIPKVHSGENLLRGPLLLMKHTEVSVCLSSLHPAVVTSSWVDDAMEYINHLALKEGRVNGCTVLPMRHIALQCKTTYKELLAKEKANTWKTVLGFKYTIEQSLVEGECTVKIPSTEDEAEGLTHEMLEDIFGATSSIKQLITLSCATTVGSYCHLALLVRSGAAGTLQYEEQEKHEGKKRGRSKFGSDLISSHQRQLARASLRLVDIDRGLVSLYDMDTYTYKLCNMVLVVCITGQTTEQKAKQLAVVTEAATAYSRRNTQFYYFEYHNWDRDARWAIEARSPQIYAWITLLLSNTHFTHASAYPQPFLCDVPNNKNYTLSADRTRKATSTTLIQFMEEYYKGSLDELVPPVKGSKVSGWGSHSARYLLLPTDKSNDGIEDDMLHSWRKTVKEQLGVAQEFLGDDLFRGPILMMWLQSFGGAFHSPVTTFFYLELGATELDIGTYSFVAAAGALVTAPFQGWYLDKNGSYVIMLVSVFFCALGCFIRGYAPSLTFVLIGMLVLGFGGVNMEMVTMSHIVKVTSEARRHAYISGFMAQLGFFRIFGRSLFPIFDWALRDGVGMHNDLNRFRVHMSGCIVFCFVGMGLLIASRKVLKDAAIVRQEDTTVEHEDTTTEETNKMGVALASVAVAARSASAVIIEMLWPLFLRDTYGWGATEYSYVLFLNSIVMMVAVSYAPRLDEIFGHSYTVNLLSMVISFAVLIAFNAPLVTASGGIVIHIIATITCCAAVASLEPIIKVFASLFVVRASQARAFGGMATASGLGSMLGSFLGASLYTRSPMYPMYFVMFCAVTIVMVLFSLAAPSPSSPKPLNTTDQEMASFAVRQRSGQFDHEVPDACEN